MTSRSTHGGYGSNESLDRLSTQEDNSPENLTPDGRDLVGFVGDSLAILWKDWSKDMKLNLLDASQFRYSLSGECPHCNLPTVFVRVTDPYRQDIDRDHVRLTAVMECQGCKHHILSTVLTNYDQSRWEYLIHYPLGSPNDSVDKHVPPSIAADFSEALRCFWAKSYKATVAMCRRCVEASCKDKKAKGGNLKERIDDLAKHGVITDPLRRMAHRVRLTANEELHGAPDDLDTFTEPEAAAIVKCVREYFHHVYVMPALLDAYDEPQGEAAKKES